MKIFHIHFNVGKVKYVVNYHDGIKKHKDGSNFFDIKTFSNKKLFNKFQKDLLSDGYVFSSNLSY